MDGRMDGCQVYNVGRATQWAFADGLGVNPKADPETIVLEILILRQVAKHLLNFSKHPEKRID